MISLHPWLCIGPPTLLENWDYYSWQLVYIIIQTGGEYELLTQFFL